VTKYKQNDKVDLKWQVNQYYRQTSRCGIEVPRDGRPAEYRCGKNGVPFSATTRPTYMKPGSYG